MNIGTDEKPIIVTGSIIFQSRVCPFTFDSRTGELQPDRYEPQAELRELSSFEQHLIAQSIRSIVEGPITDIRFGEYFCEDCKEWAAANKAQWSMGICLSCSLDRGSEMADYFDSEQVR